MREQIIKVELFRLLLQMVLCQLRREDQSGDGHLLIRLGPLALGGVFLLILVVLQIVLDIGPIFVEVLGG